MDEFLKSVQSVADCDKAIEAIGDNPMFASIKVLLEGHKEVLVKAEEAKRKLLPFVTLTDRTLGQLPAWSPDWRTSEATQQVRITTIEADDTSKPQEPVEANGETVMRYAKRLERNVTIGVAITEVTKAKSSSSSSGEGKRTTNIVKKEGMTLVPQGQWPSGAAFIKAHNDTHPNDLIDAVTEGGGNSYRAMAKHGYLATDDDGNILAK